MAVYTQVSAERIAELLSRYDVGTLVSAKGIAEGVENSNYVLETDRSRFILTLYEKRVDADDLPFFLKLLDHLAARGQPVPPAIADKAGRQIQSVNGKPACLIVFLPGLSPGEPNVAQSRSAGAALGKLHQSLIDFADLRPNTLSLPGWHELARRCGDALEEIAPDLGKIVAEELAFLDANWPSELPRSAIHADLFPDNVLMLDDKVTGIIDFYFACTDIRAYDLAVTHAAWCFDDEGRSFDAERSAALIAGYAEQLPLSDDEREALPILARGASLRFLLTRAWDWLNTPDDALVTRKDPAAFLRRLEFYRAAGSELFAR
ncbi:homoserine kinase [Parasphingopyxis lamellibrachiae]|uniref:Homoserine kinase n=1 Tax=Parasphingopyxis lamellibrachiae TaxID=680125 RepID=A0A3D9FCF9_9SPHN|nr:homoserine kinase [Parasphingopyxis lamellibrachiae]RED15272.1 homoserine kinase [Parasphingopyxis lamellibrachiae]